MRGILGVLVVGLLAGCGGVEEVESEQDISAQALPPCQQACVNGYQYCRTRTTTPIEQCAAERNACLEECLEGGAAPEGVPVGALKGHAAPLASVVEEKVDVTSLTFPACAPVYETCRIDGANRPCTTPTGETAYCYCEVGWWECPAFE